MRLAFFLFCLILLPTTMAISASSKVPKAPKVKAPPPLVFNLWPDGQMPGHGAPTPEKELPDCGDYVHRLTDISQPILTVYRAPAKTTGPDEATTLSPAILISPGGGYSLLAYNKEGTEIATWLNSIGITCILLKYRVPNNRDGALQDIGRAMRFVRAHAAEWQIDPARIGAMGFSAGGHLSARLSAHPEDPGYTPLDAIDTQNARPDFVVLVYPAYLDHQGQVAPEVAPTAKNPPTLIIQTEDDAKYVPGSKLYHAALDQAQVPNQFLLYKTGGHGYGLWSVQEVAIWPETCRDWLTRQGILPAP